MATILVAWGLSSYATPFSMIALMANRYFGYPVTTVTVQIKTLLVGDQEFDSAKTLSAFALGFVLFFFTLSLNVVALRVVQKYREQYD